MHGWEQLMLFIWESFRVNMYMYIRRNPQLQCKLLYKCFTSTTVFHVQSTYKVIFQYISYIFSGIFSIVNEWIVDSLFYRYLSSQNYKSASDNRIEIHLKCLVSVAWEYRKLMYITIPLFLGRGFWQFFMNINSSLIFRNLQKILSQI